MTEKMATCFQLHFLAHVEDPDTKAILDWTYRASQNNIQKLVAFFQREE